MVNKGCSLIGKDANDYSCLETAALSGNLELVKWVYENGCTLELDNEDESKNTSLILIATCENVEIFKWFFEQGLSVNNQYHSDRTCLLAACSSKKKADIVKWLIENGYDTSKTDVDEEGYSCIQNAAYAGNLEVVKYLYEKGLSLEEEDDDGENCFQIACRKGFITLAKWIHKTTKLSVDKPDSDGDTPAHLALQYVLFGFVKMAC